MGYWAYMKDRMAPIVVFSCGMAAFLSVGKELWAGAGAAALAIAFFFSIFSVLWLLGAIIGRKPRRDLARLR